MTITLTKLTDEREYPEHWRILVVDGNSEIYHDSATSKRIALERASGFLEGIK